MDSAVYSIIENFKQFMPPQIIVFIISILPILELRGGLLAAFALDIQWVQALVICVLGTMVPVPFILIFIKKIFNWMEKRNKFFKKIVNKMETKAEKNIEKIKKYEKLGVFILAAIPLPGAGAWTCSLVAAFLNMTLKESVPYIFLGTIVAGLIMVLLGYGLLGNILV